MPRRPSLRLAALVVLLAASSLHAAAPQVRSQAPGFYRWMLGDFEITALDDGTFDLDRRTMLTGGETASTDALFRRSFDSASVPISVNAYLVNTGDRLVLIDTGAANRFAATLGRLEANLVASGYRPDQVDDVLITHLHPDHVGGLLNEAGRAFPNAVVHVDRTEAAYWMSDVAKSTAPADRQAFFDIAVASLRPYRDAGRLETFDGEVDVMDGIRSMPAPGHTPGHTMYSVESQGQRLVVWGDLMELRSVQFVDPTVTIVFDVDPKATADRRPAAYADAAAGRYWIAASHLPFPGIGHLRADGAGYAWVPIGHDRVR